MVVEALTVVLVVGSWLLLGVSLWQIWRLGDWWTDPLGKIVFGSLASLKLWIFVFLGYVLVGALIGGVPRVYRVPINTLMALAIFAQAVTVCWAIHRYHQGITEDVAPQRQTQTED